jgi:hypothetical protein
MTETKKTFMKFAFLNQNIRKKMILFQVKKLFFLQGGISLQGMPDMGSVELQISKWFSSFELTISVVVSNLNSTYTPVSHP